VPQPFGPTMPTSCPGREMTEGSTKDLNPASLIWLRRNLEKVRRYNAGHSNRTIKAQATPNEESSAP